MVVVVVDQGQALADVLELFVLRAVVVGEQAGQDRHPRVGRAAARP
ncbi:hypothetical protein [Nonomuraea sp. NPDC003804]